MSEQTKERPEPRTPEDVRGRFDWLDSRMDGVKLKAWLAIGTLIAVAVLGFGAWWVYGRDEGMTMGMPGQADGGMDMAEVEGFPPVTGFYQGQEVTFAHTEASDPAVAEMLTDMMGSPVLVVPELAEVPDQALARVYVFANGVQPDGATGPFGFQADVFDTVPGDAGYSPLRAVLLVRWQEGAQPRLLRSAAEVEEAVASDQVQIEQTGVFVNMPFLAWPGGSR